MKKQQILPPQSIKLHHFLRSVQKAKTRLRLSLALRLHFLYCLVFEVAFSSEIISREIHRLTGAFHKQASEVL